MAADETRPQRPASSQAPLGLLEHITATSLDEDYAHVSRSRAARGEPAHVRPGVAALVVLAVFGVLLAVAAVQTSREAPDAASSKAYLVKRVNAGKAQVAREQSRATTLQKDVSAEQHQFLEASSAGRALQAQTARLGVATGAVPVHGPGVRVTVDDAPNATSDAQHVQDVDLQLLVNGLWQVGAEAVSINGQRLTSLSAIRHAGSAITVDFVSLIPPYVISAVGNPDTMAAKFIDTPGAQDFLVNQSRYGLKFSIDSPKEPLTLPAASHLRLRYAHPGRAAR